jgi:hypothetical protein
MLPIKTMDQIIIVIKIIGESIHQVVICLEGDSDKRNTMPGWKSKQTPVDVNR